MTTEIPGTRFTIQQKLKNSIQNVTPFSSELNRYRFSTTIGEWVHILNSEKID